jgi:hypothetical protein
MSTHTHTHTHTHTNIQPWEERTLQNTNIHTRFFNDVLTLSAFSPVTCPAMTARRSAVLLPILAAIRAAKTSARPKQSICAPRRITITSWHTCAAAAHESLHGDTAVA